MLFNCNSMGFTQQNIPFDKWLLEGRYVLIWRQLRNSQTVPFDSAQTLMSKDQKRIPKRIGVLGILRRIKLSGFLFCLCLCKIFCGIGGKFVYRHLKGLDEKRIHVFTFEKTSRLHVAFVTGFAGVGN